MPKKIKYESAKYHILISVREFCEKQTDINLQEQIKKFILTFEFSYLGKDRIKLTWRFPTLGSKDIDYSSIEFYKKDTQQTNSTLITDDVYQKNRKLFNMIVDEIIREAKLIT